MLYYIAGPMRGYPRYNFDAFDAARDQLIELGHVVISPADMDRDIGFDPDKDPFGPKELREAVGRDTEAITRCDALVMLDGWEDSHGAKIEYAIGLWLGKPAYSQHDLEKPLETIVFPHGKQAEKSSTRSSVLLDAANLIDGDRNAQYGPPTQDFRRTAAIWSAMFEHKLKEPFAPHEVATAMIGLKLSRLAWQAEKRDSWVDTAGYAGCGYECAVEESDRHGERSDGESGED